MAGGDGVGLSALAARARAVVVLRYWEDLSVEQTAQVLGCTPGSVKSQSARALDKLRAGLAAAGAQTRIGCRRSEGREDNRAMSPS